MTKATQTTAEALAAAELARWETEGGSPPQPYAAPLGAAPGGDAAMKRRMARFLHDHKRTRPSPG